MNGRRAALVPAFLAAFGIPVMRPAAQEARSPAPSASSPAGRHALVIGNAAYKLGPLRNPVNDARAIGAALRELAFDVVVRENLDQKELRRAILEFTDRLRSGGVGVFFYAGHGMQVAGRNYMIPVDAEIRSEAEVEIEGVDVGHVLSRLETARTRINVVILDACRDNPFARRATGDRPRSAHIPPARAATASKTSRGTCPSGSRTGTTPATTAERLSMRPTGHAPAKRR